MSRALPSLANYFTAGNEVDDLAFFKAVMDLSTQLDSPPSMDQSSTDISAVTAVPSRPQHYTERFLTDQAQRDRKLKRQRELRLQAEMKEVQDRPSINQPQAAGAQPPQPLAVRLEKELRRRREHRVQRETERAKECREKVEKECTFAPSLRPSKLHPQCSFLERSQAWAARVKQERELSAERCRTAELQQCRSRPQIDEKSQKLSRCRPHNYDSAVQCKRCKTPDAPVFRPQLSPNSQRIAQASRPCTEIHSRLYSLSTPKAPSQKSIVKASPSLKSPPTHVTSLSFSVNTGTVSPVPVSDVEYDESMRFLLERLRGGGL